MQMRLPALRERLDDIIPLARHFLLRECHRRSKGAMFLASSAERALRAYAWPGNIRELEHAIERAVLLAERDEVDVAGLNLSKFEEGPQWLDGMTLPDAEELLIRNAMDRHDHNLQRSADALGISRQSLYRRLEKQRVRSGFEPVD